jgi:hypothetical protein
MLPSGDLVQQCELQPGHRHTQALVPTLPPGPLTTLPMPSPRHQAPGGRSPRTARRSEEASDSGTHGGGAPPLQRRRVTQLGRAVEGGGLGAGVRWRPATLARVLVLARCRLSALESPGLLAMGWTVPLKTTDLGN